jgi:hypothetical protein
MRFSRTLAFGPAQPNSENTSWNRRRRLLLPSNQLTTIGGAANRRHAGRINIRERSLSGTAQGAGRSEELARISHSTCAKPANSGPCRRPRRCPLKAAQPSTPGASVQSAWLGWFVFTRWKTVCSSMWLSLFFQLTNQPAGEPNLRIVSIYKCDPLANYCWRPAIPVVHNSQQSDLVEVQSVGAEQVMCFLQR